MSCLHITASFGQPAADTPQGQRPSFLQLGPGAVPGPDIREVPFTTELASQRPHPCPVKLTEQNMAVQIPVLTWNLVYLVFLFGGYWGLNPECLVTEPHTQHPPFKKYF